jgi:hypothetical protein
VNGRKVKFQDVRLGRKRGEWSAEQLGATKKQGRKHLLATKKFQSGKLNSTHNSAIQYKKIVHFKQLLRKLANKQTCYDVLSGRFGLADVADCQHHPDGWNWSYRLKEM